MSAAIRGKTAIVGIGSAGVGEAPGYSAIELLSVRRRSGPLPMPA